MSKSSNSTLSMPENSAEGIIPTLNGTGFMTTQLDRYSQQFVEYAAKQIDPVLEIAAAYGVATIKALRAGATVIANDLEERHLAILKAQTPEEYLDRLTLMPGSFPDDLEFESNSLAGVLACNIVHFLDGNKLEQAAQKLYDWLKPNAKAFIIATTPYLDNCGSLISIYEENVKSGKKWPGYMSGMRNIMCQKFASFASNVPDTLHLLEPDILSRVFKEAGFTIETATMFTKPGLPPELQLDGRESVAVVAVKN